MLSNLTPLCWGLVGTICGFCGGGCAMNASSNLVICLKWRCFGRLILWCIHILIMNPRKPRACLFWDSTISWIFLEMTRAISNCFPLTICQMSYVVFIVEKEVWLTDITLLTKNFIQNYSWMIMSDLLTQTWMSCLF